MKGQAGFRGQAPASCRVAHGRHMLTWVPFQSGQDGVPGLDCAKMGVLPWLWQPLGRPLLHSMADSHVGWWLQSCWLHALMADCWPMTATCCCCGCLVPQVSRGFWPSLRLEIFE